MTDPTRLESLGRDLLVAAAAYWREYQQALGSNAVIWLSGDDGSLVVFTRGEFRDTIMQNIAPIRHEHQFATPLSAGTAEAGPTKETLVAKPNCEFCRGVGILYTEGGPLHCKCARWVAPPVETPSLDLASQVLALREQVATYKLDPNDVRRANDSLRARNSALNVRATQAEARCERAERERDALREAMQYVWDALDNDDYTEAMLKADQFRAPPSVPPRDTTGDV